VYSLGPVQPVAWQRAQAPCVRYGDPFACADPAGKWARVVSLLQHTCVQLASVVVVHLCVLDGISGQYRSGRLV